MFNGLAGWSGTQKEHEWKIGDKEIWGRSMYTGNSLAVQWLGLSAFIAVGPSSILGRELKILKAVRLKKLKKRGFPGGAVVENLPANAGDTGSSPGPGGSHMPQSD